MVKLQSGSYYFPSQTQTKHLCIKNFQFLRPMNNDMHLDSSVLFFLNCVKFLVCSLKILLSKYWVLISEWWLKAILYWCRVTLKYTRASVWLCLGQCVLVCAKMWRYLEVPGHHSFVPGTYEGFHKQKQTPQPIAEGFLSTLVA